PLIGIAVIPVPGPLPDASAHRIQSVSVGWQALALSNDEVVVASEVTALGCRRLVSPGIARAGELAASGLLPLRLCRQRVASAGAGVPTGKPTCQLHSFLPGYRDHGFGLVGPRGGWVAAL